MTITRRNFLLGAGSLALLIPLGPTLKSAMLLQQAQLPEGNQELNDWIWVGPDNQVVIGVSQSEVGQGIYTGLAEVVAAEMDADWDKVEVQFVTNRDAYRQVAGGEDKAQFVAASTSMTNFYQRTRLAGAQGRAFFLAAGARELGVEPSYCRTEKSFIIDTLSGRKVSYSEVIHWASDIPLEMDPPLKTPEQEHQSFIGQPLRRVDTPAKVNGKALFGIDVDVPDMLVGVPWMVPSLNGKIVRILNESRIRALPGVVDLVLTCQLSTLNMVKLDPDMPLNTVIVVANSYWQAKKAADLLQVEYQHSTKDSFSTASINKQSKLALQSGAMVAATDRHNAPEIINAARDSNKYYQASYRSGYVVHATMEPCNGTVFVEKDRITAWGPFQGQDFVRMLLSKMFGMTAEQVVVNTTFLGGSFGRKYTPDAALHAALASKATGKPVKVIYPREIDIQHGYYRTGSSSHYQAVLDEEGYPQALWARYAGQGLHWQLQRARVKKNGGWDETIVECAYDMDYDIPALRVEESIIDQYIPLAFLRGVGSVASLFFLESFISELSYKAGIDELAYRQRLLKNAPEMLSVMNETAKLAKWDSPLPDNHFRGLAVNVWLARDKVFVSYVAAVVDIEVIGNRWRVARIFCGVDCGKVINPSLVRATIEGGLGFALSGALHSEVTFEYGAVQQSNFNNYGIINLEEMPDIEVLLVDSERSPQGTGEIATAVLAPALASALHKASGKLWQSLPFSADITAPNEV
ncbi:molybdopterin cofactor-binding domain-containing protein [Rouxiella sp. Mn2063]|uniref:xanthine dehydrogenase family protein molybdopterin-binding subunit n=1 Tax=Rouxiella sp. Mn2063 TaxID=3395262 RepID=UPI003BC6E863